jgi:predicted outer membrane lipoprotein
MRYFAFILGALLNLSGIVGLAAVYRHFSFQQFKKMGDVGENATSYRLRQAVLGSPI